MFRLQFFRVTPEYRVNNMVCKVYDDKYMTIVPFEDYCHPVQDMDDPNAINFHIIPTAMKDERPVVNMPQEFTQRKVTYAAQPFYGMRAWDEQRVPQGKSNRDSHDNSDSDDQTNKKKWPDAIHGKFAQSIGGISSGSEVTHFIDAHYLWTPDQQQKQLERNQQEQMKQLQELGKELMVRQQAATKQGAGEAPNTDSVTDTRSSMHAHSIRNYLMGISRESGPDQHPLIPDLPLEWLEYLEIVSKK